MEKNDMIRLIEDYPTESLILTMTTRYSLEYEPFKQLSLEGFEPAAVSALLAMAEVYKRRIAHYKQGILPRITKWQDEKSQTLVIVKERKEDIVVSDIMTSPNLAQQEFQPIVVKPVQNFLVKSIVLDAGECDPEVVTTVQDNEMLVEAAEVEVQIITEGDVQYSYTYSGYDRSKSIPNVKVALQRTYENPVHVLLSKRGEIVFKHVVRVPSVRQLYYASSARHKKFIKYNPREYCYLTLYLISTEEMQRVEITLRRIGTIISEEKGKKIYRGPDIRRGKKVPLYRNYVYPHGSRRVDQSPDVMTVIRRQVLQQYDDKEAINLGYSVQISRSNMSTVYTVDHNIALEKRTERLLELAQNPYYDQCDSDED